MPEKVLSPRLILSILAIALLGFTDIMLETALNVSFPALMKQLHVDSATVQWLTSGVILLTSMIVIMSPWLKARFSNRSQFMVAGVVSLIGIFIDATSNQFGLILFGRLLQGVGAGVGLPLMNNVVFEQVPDNRRGTMIGLASLIVSFSPALGPAFGGFLTAYYGWHMIFWVVLPIQLFALIVGWFTIQQIDPLKKARFDLIGWLLLSCFFVGGLITVDRLSGHGLFNILSLTALAVMLIGIFGYYFYAQKEAEPLLSPKMFALPMFRQAVLAAVLIQVVNLTFNYAIPMGLQLVLKQSSSVAGLSLFPGAIGFAIMSIISGNLYDRFGPKLPNAIGLGFIVLGMVWIVLVPFTVWSMTIAFVITQLGGGFWFGNNMTNAISHLDRAFHSAGNSIFSAVNNYSAAVGIALAASIISIFQKGATNMSAATLNGIQWTYRFDVILIALAVYLSMKVMKGAGDGPMVIKD
ncbi:MFS transporter [Fructobacillus americanaquae]|uniref:MFS transporter n=1 Tax=Fructobacillus americanaquae TaxID=2940302 RepID=A0ABY5C144_9LACO|nr:MFS transporter [Fructobacillus americanaquae]USS92494.1 MFS transporter [Fructobacillus americanaquae]